MPKTAPKTLWKEQTDLPVEDKSLYNFWEAVFEEVQQQSNNLSVLNEKSLYNLEN
jgi:hypothetical protein